MTKKMKELLTEVDRITDAANADMTRHATDPSSLALAKRIFFLAYEASQVVGAGLLQAVNDATEEKVWKEVFPRAVTAGETTAIYGDYVFGRMMKLEIVISEDGSIETSPSRTSDPEYQSWASKYPTYASLVEAAEASLQQEQGEME